MKGISKFWCISPWIWSFWELERLAVLSVESPEGNRAQITCAWTAWRIEVTCHLEHVTDLTLCWRCCSSKGVSTQLDATFHASVLQIVFLASCTSSVRRNQCHSLMPCALVLSCASSFLLRTIAALQLLLRGWLLLHWLCSVRQHQIHIHAYKL